MPLTIADIPEELLERILALILVQSPEPSPRPSWHPYQAPSPANHPSVISPLLVSRSWLRIATPIHYRHPVLRTSRHAQLLLRALRHSPSLAQCIRSLHIHETSPPLRDLIPLCTHLTTLDVTIDNADAASSGPGAPVPAGDPGAHPRSVVDFCDAFMHTRSIRHLVIRKNAYLTQPNVIYAFEQLGKAIARWHRLETVQVAFRLSPSPSATALVKALAVAPRLHTLRTQLPVVWNTLLLDIAQNPALMRVIVSPESDVSSANLFMMEARRHPRLMDLFPIQSTSHPGISVNTRARASSAIVAGKTIVPIATWDYERNVPPPQCPPVRRTGPGAQSAPGVVNCDPSAYYAYAHHPAQASSSHVAHVMQYPPQYNTVQHQSANQYWQGHAFGLPPVTHAQGRGTPAHQGSVTGGPPVRRSAPGGRRMTAS